MDRRAFDQELGELINRCEANEPTKATSLAISMIAVVDRWSLAEFGRLAEFEEIRGVLTLAFAQVRAATGNAAPPAGGLQA